MTRHSDSSRYVVCLSKQGYKASLVVRKIYARIPDDQAAERGLVRVVDESCEDYLFPDKLFAAIELPREVRQRLVV